MILNLIDKFALGKYGSWFGLLSRLTLGGVLFAAGWLKIFTPAKSQMAVRAYEVLPIPLANFLGIFLPWFEVGLGVLLILGIAVRISAFFGGALMVVFIAAISQVGHVASQLIADASAGVAPWTQVRRNI